ncbi:hypothetical protein QVD17_29710 [Tagetes erecta]|uniref:Uncharacterized protein n=1 Tax=Tagetes erecta TaxID=13708 RepID=A0AAD8NMT2_TARER|nr:hypothetical protein QVD17_29710 [Tagetes erecta]
MNKRTSYYNKTVSQSPRGDFSALYFLKFPPISITLPFSRIRFVGIRLQTHIRDPPNTQTSILLGNPNYISTFLSPFLLRPPSPSFHSAPKRFLLPISIYRYVVADRRSINPFLEFGFSI